MKRILLLLLAVVLLLCAGCGGKTTEVTISPAPRVTAAPAPSPTPKPTETPAPMPESTPELLPLAVEDEAAEAPDRALTAEEVEPTPEPTPTPAQAFDYVLNTNTKKIHRPTCASVGDILPKNRQDVTGTLEEFVAQGYDPCKRCKPR